MTLLLDGNVLLPAIFAPHLLRPTLRELLTDRGSKLYVSYATMCELLAKSRRTPITLRDQRVEFRWEDVNELGAELLPLLRADIVSASELADIHRDPFDRMLVAQAMRLDATIISSDRKLHLYGVRVIEL